MYFILYGRGDVGILRQPIRTIPPVQGNFLLRRGTIVTYTCAGSKKVHRARGVSQGHP